MDVNDKTVLYVLLIAVSLHRQALIVKAKEHGIYSASASGSLSLDKRDLCRHPSTTAAKTLTKTASAVTWHCRLVSKTNRFFAVSCKWRSKFVDTV
jgi:hypothetical protein